MPSINTLARSRNSQRGFTIVELLIVIVIIGILAAIVLLTYNGLQVKARNTHRIATARAWYATIVAYRAETGLWPDGFGAPIGDRYVCVGTGNSDSPNDPDTTGDCENWGGVFNEDTAFTTALSTVGTPPPPAVFKSIEVGAFRFKGILLVSESTTTIDAVQWPYMTFALEGENQDCSISGTIEGGPNAYVTKVVDPKIGFTPPGMNVTLCNIKLQ